MAPFRAKIGGKRMRKGENKNYRFVPFRSVPTRRGIKNAKKKQKNQKNKKIPLWRHFNQNSFEKANKGRK